MGSAAKVREGVARALDGGKMCCPIASEASVLGKDRFTDVTPTEISVSIQLRGRGDEVLMCGSGADVAARGGSSHAAVLRRRTRIGGASSKNRCAGVACGCALTRWRGMTLLCPAGGAQNGPIPVFTGANPNYQPSTSVPKPQHLALALANHLARLIVV